jgi:hypothetical protein
MITGDDGIAFDRMLTVHGEVPPRRFFGRWKDFGPCYVRGIVEGNGDPPGDDLWVTYSVNKEDIWVSRVPVPVRWRVDEPVNDSFDDMDTGGVVRDWNVYSPVWAPARVEDVPGGRNKSLCLRDKDPYDYARTTRVFKENAGVRVSFRVMAVQAVRGLLEVDVTDGQGRRPVRLQFDRDGRIKAANGGAVVDLGSYAAGTWQALEIVVDAGRGAYSVAVDGKQVLELAELAEKVGTVERLSFRTGEYRTEPTRETNNEAPHEPLPGADEAVEEAAFYVDDVKVKDEG